MIAFTPVPTINLGFFAISTHGLLIAIGFLVAEILARRAAKAKGINPDLVDNAAIVAIVAGLIGARLIYILTLGQGMSVIQMLELWHGGLSSHGGYIFGIVAGLWYVKWKKIDVLHFADLVLPYVLIGWAIGRIGCFLNWDSYGKVTTVPWAVIVYGEPRHPTQLYETIGYLLAFFLLRQLTRLRAFAARKKGSAAALALLFFALVRITVDFFRGDPAVYLLLSRLVTGALALLCILFLVWPPRKAKNVVQ